MKQFHCDCGHRVFFDNTECGRCGAGLGFNPYTLDIASLTPRTSGGYADRDGGAFRYCQNFHKHGVCNWLVRMQDAEDYCVGCSRTEIIPSLAVPGNWLLWNRLEAAKRRLLYTLLALGLQSSEDNGSQQLRFQFLEDRRQNPAVLESFVGTGHMDGTITINVMEADDVARNAAREQMQERYRTLLGHFRHESGHFFFASLVCTPDKLEKFRRLFGDERADYGLALESYYRDGARKDWPEYFVSAYASAHAHEDWAETFAHYLHILDALETSSSMGLFPAAGDNSAGWILEWMDLAVTLNELNRSLGLDDPYPFTLTEPVVRKLTFIDRLVRPPV